jgi:lipid-A-disaccharide synthase
MNKKFNEYTFVFHSTDENKDLIQKMLHDFHLENTEVVFDKDIKSAILLNSIFAVAKSGTVSLEICNAKVPSIIIYKINFINFMIMKFLVKVNFANIINIINNKEIIPELLQNECNAKEIYNSVTYMLKNPELAKKQLDYCNQTLEGIRSKSSSSNEVALILRESLIS